MMNFIREYRRLRAARRANQDVMSKLGSLMGRSNRIAALVSFWVVAQWSLDFPEILTDFNVFDIDLDQASVLQFADNFLQATRALVIQKWPYIILAVFTYWWFVQYRDAVETEIGIIDEVFHDSLKPKRWQKVSDRFLLSVLSFILVLTFLLLAATLQHIPIYCTIVMALWLQDTLGNASIRRNLRRYLNDPAYHLPEDHPDAHFFQCKRDIARQYWLERPHLERIALLIFLTVIVLISSISEEFIPVDLHPAVSTLTMSGIILGNELTMKS